MIHLGFVSKPSNKPINRLIGNQRIHHPITLITDIKKEISSLEEEIKELQMDIAKIKQ